MSITYPPEMLPSPDEGDEAEVIVVDPANGAHYEAGDCVVEQIGEFTLDDGRKIYGALLAFPVEPPALKFSIVWSRTPMRLITKDAAERLKQNR